MSVGDKDKSVFVLRSKRYFLATPHRNMPSLIDKWLHGDKAIAAMGTIILAMLMSITPHFFLDMLLLATYHDAQESFQRLYLCIHFVCSLLSFVIIAYSFWAINAQTYHAFCNMRSWSLLIGLFMFFSGFFSILGFALDWHKFRDHCASDISYSTVGQESHRCREVSMAICDARVKPDSQPSMGHDRSGRRSPRPSVSFGRLQRRATDFWLSLSAAISAFTLPSRSWRKRKRRRCNF